ncbi:hypothetical protein BJY52DRAFT_1306369 [Lactarius psammicola]|nr:hypothetical protein BJY52DRAFT_1306369 [Lactarius psammicola]
MATKTQTTPSTFPRIRFGFGPKSSRTRLPPDPPENPDDDSDWVIPYNGPYELPPSIPRSQNRDSWGQLLGSVLSNLGSATSSTDRTHERSGAQVAGGRSASHLPSSGAFSSHPYRTSSALDAAGPPGPTTTTSRVRGGNPTPIITSSTAFAHMDTTGGVGESPTPMRRSPLQTSPQAGTANRLSLANLLTFGGSTRKSRSDSVHRPSVKRSRNGTPTLDPLQSNRATGIDVQPSPRSHSLAHVGPSTEHTPRQRSNTLVGTSMAPAAGQSSSRNFPTSSQHRDSPLSPHPYAYAYSSSHSGAPRRAPIISPPLTQSHSLDKGKGVDRSYQYPQPPSTDTLNVAEVPPHLRPTSRTSLLKTISAPNLRNLSRGLPIRKPTQSRGKYRWLSPETWCDALLFPRPRFLEHIDGEPLQSSGQRNSTIPAPKAHTLPHTGRVRTPLGRSWLRGSRSAVNLHVPNSDSSRGPPRAEPMLMAPKGSFEGDGWSSFSRPRSFAQDDLALPSSPVPSIVRVLEMGASFERERATWRSQAERSLQSSKLTRSLGRSRSQSAGRTRAQLKDTGGVGFLATKTLLGNQLVAPTVGTPTSSEGTQTLQTRSGTSHARTMSSGGHSRAGSKGKIAAIRAATGLCISDDKTSPVNERGDVITRYDSGGKGAGIEGQHNVPNSGAGSSPPLVAVDSSAVGIALSSPPPSSEEVAAAVQATRPIYVHDHPYAQGGYSVPRRSHTRSSSDYAGPHPSAVAVTASPTVLASDMSARHRLPPQAVLHPYASSAHPSAAPSQPAPAAPPASPSAPHQTLPEAPAPSRPRINPRSPLRHPLASSGTREAEHTVTHAYAAGNRFSGAPLAFADALSYGLQRRGSADSGLGDSETHYDVPSSSTQLLTPFPDVMLATTPEYLRMNFGHNSTFLSLHSRGTVASSPPATLNPPVFATSPSADSRRSAQASSPDEPGPGSRASSPLQSPRPFATIEDLDRYRNLFYYPKASGVSGTPSDEHRRTFSRDTASLAGLEVSSTGSISGGSGLAALARQLGDEFGVMQDTTGGLSDGPSRMWWVRYGAQRGDGTGHSTDPNVAPSNTSDLNSNSDLNTNPSDLDATLLPLSLHQSQHHQSEGSLTVRVPQDVESNTSSVMERSQIEAMDDELLRVGTVGVASTPLTTTPALRLSFVGDVHRGRSQDSLTLGNYEANRTSVSSTYTADATDNDDDDDDGNNTEEEEEEEEDSTLPATARRASVPHSAATRSSYMTNDTGTASRISGLSDFPIPPNQTVVSLDRVAVLKSYFGDDARDALESEPEPGLAASRRVLRVDDPSGPDGQAAAVAAAAMRLEQSSLAGPSQPSRERSADSEPELR